MMNNSKVIDLSPSQKASSPSVNHPTTIKTLSAKNSPPKIPSTKVSPIQVLPNKSDIVAVDISSFSPSKKPPSPTVNQPATIKIPSVENSLTKVISNKPDIVAIDIGRQEAASCPICIGDYLPEQLKSHLKCSHAFCNACLTEYLNTKVTNNQVLDIPCPQSGCDQVWTNKAVKKVLNAKEYRKYKEFVERKKSIKHPNQKYCPRPGCARVIKVLEGQEFSLCECETKVCNACFGLYHEGKTCMEAVDPAFESYAKENGVKFCMICKTIVIKEVGCNTIKCAVCDYKWCWICGREYDISHVCPGEWSPIPPASVRQDDFKGRFKKMWKEASTTKRIGVGFLLFLLSPFLFLAFLIMAPTYYVLQTRPQVARRKPIRSFCVVIGVFLFGLLYLPETLMALGLLGLFFVFVYPVVYLVRTLKKKYGKEQPKPQLNTRWHSRNPENFIYRPTNPHA